MPRDGLDTGPCLGLRAEENALTTTTLGATTVTALLKAGLHATTARLYVKVTI